MGIRPPCATFLRSFTSTPSDAALGAEEQLRIVREAPEMSGRNLSASVSVEDVEVTRAETYYSCCPNVPYYTLRYQFTLARRARFYIFLRFLGSHVSLKIGQSSEIGGLLSRKVGSVAWTQI